MSINRRFGWVLRTEPLAEDVYVVADGKRLPAAVHDLRLAFDVPANAQDLWIISGTSKPSDIHGTTDERELGICIQQITIRAMMEPERHIACDNVHLNHGFYGHELAWRWTNGRAKLSHELWAGIATGFQLLIYLKDLPLPRWVNHSRQQAA